MGKIEVDPEYIELLKVCKEIIDRGFAPCGLKDAVEERIRKLVMEWKRRKAEAEKRGKIIGGLMVIFRELLKVVEEAEYYSKRYGKPVCKYLDEKLSCPYYKKGCLGYVSLTYWQY